VAASLTSALPGFFDAVRPFVALSPVLDAVRAVATGGSVTGPLLGVLAWVLLASIASALAVVRQRGMSVRQYLRAYA
jgi:putative membrane protein